MEDVGRKKKFKRGESTVSIQKKSLISTLKSAKKANVVKEEVTVSGATASPSKHTLRAAPSKRTLRAAPSKRTLRAAPSKRTLRAAPSKRAPRVPN